MPAAEPPGGVLVGIARRQHARQLPAGLHHPRPVFAHLAQRAAACGRGGRAGGAWRRVPEALPGSPGRICRAMHRAPRACRLTTSRWPPCREGRHVQGYRGQGGADSGALPSPLPTVVPAVATRLCLQPNGQVDSTAPPETQPATAPRGPLSTSLGAVVVCSSVASTQHHGRVGVRRPAGAEPVQGPRHYQRVRGPCSGRSGRAIADLQCPICGSGRAAATPTQRCMIARCCGREWRGGQPCQPLCSSAGVGQSRGSSGQPAWQLRRRAGAATQRQCGGRAVRRVLLCRPSAP